MTQPALALYFGNRGFFPEKLVAEARREVQAALGAKTDDGRLVFYLGEGEFTSDPIEPGFFGCAGVAAIDRLPDRLLAIGRQGFRHHVSVTVGHVATPLREAFREYLGCGIAGV